MLWTHSIRPRSRAMFVWTALLTAIGALTWPAAARDREPISAGEAFWNTWSDGRAELDGYRVRTPRYGQPRDGHVVLIYVTEEMNKRTLIKDDTGRVPPGDKEVVMKLNHTLTFRTGIYPYSVMTSVFSPVGSDGTREQFAPVKISFTAQEWCGHVYHTLEPTAEAFESEIRSYFSSEGDANTTRVTEPFTLYEDALWIQLRELDGPFEGGGDWSGELVPSMWSARRAHRPLEPVAATITRATTTVEGTPVTRFTLRYGDFTREFDVESGGARRILAWRTSEGEEAVLTGSTRLPYWQLNDVGDERYLAEIGLIPTSMRTDEDGTAR